MIGGRFMLVTLSFMFLYDALEKLGKVFHKVC